MEATISKRISKVKGQMYEVAWILADYMMQAVGGMAGAWDMWKLQMVSKLLANCGSWVGTLERHYNTLDALQNRDLSKLDRINKKECRFMQSYMPDKSLKDFRLEFWWRTVMLDCRGWMPGK